MSEALIPVVSRLSQIAMCTTDIPGTARVFAEALGFALAGGRPLWGERMARTQELPTGVDTRGLLWWLVGSQDFFQLELFSHTNPPVRLADPSRTAADLGWTRFGVHVPDIDGTIDRLQSLGIDPVSDPQVGRDRTRRVCFREPGSQVFVELLERPAAPSDPVPHYDLMPGIAYVALSVPDLGPARTLFGEVFGLTELSSDVLHGPEGESLWLLDGADAARAVFDVGGIRIEVSHYTTPKPRPPAEEALLSDQGLMNAAFGFRYQADIDAAFAAAEAAGATASVPVPRTVGGTYLRVLGGVSLELLLVPRELDADYGFVPMPTFPRPLIWPHADLRR